MDAPCAAIADAGRLNAPLLTSATSVVSSSAMNATSLFIKASSTSLASS
jgi:hypothetical protein